MRERYRIDDLILDVGARRVERDGQVLDVSGHALDVLIELVRCGPSGSAAVTSRRTEGNFRRKPAFKRWYKRHAAAFAPLDHYCIDRQLRYNRVREQIEDPTLLVPPPRQQPPACTLTQKLTQRCSHTSEFDSPSCS